MAHVGLGESAELIHNAWLRTIEDGVHTADIYSPAHSKEQVSTDQFADAVIARFGERASELGEAHYPSQQLQIMPKQL